MARMYDRPTLGPDGWVVDETPTPPLPNVVATTDPVTGGIGKVKSSGRDIMRGAGVKIPRRIVGTRKAFQASGSVLGAAYTIQNEIAASGHFDYVRLLFANDTASASTVRNCKIAVAGDAGNDGTGLTWSQVTFNDAGSSTLPPSASGATTTQAVAAGTGTAPNAVPTFKWSDWIPLSSISRSDGGTYPLLQVRTYLQTGDVAVSVNGTNEALPLNTDGTGFVFRGTLAGGDKVTTPSGTAMAAADNNGWAGFAAVQFMYRDAGLSVVTVGDSITRGQGSNSTTTGHKSWGHIACADLADEGFGPITYANWGYSSQTRATSIDIARQIIATDYPSVIAFFPWSQNDGYTASSINAGWARTLAFVQECQVRGVVPIVCTSIPNVNLDSTADAARLAINAWILAMSDLIVVKCDFAAVMTNGATPARILASLSDDGIHPNVAGHAAMATAFKSALIESTAF